MFKRILQGYIFIASTLGLSGVILACPPVDPYSLWLPKDKEFAKERFDAKAKMLNDSGQCVIEGAFGRSYKKYYIAVSKTGDVRDAKILRFTYEELLN